MADSAVNALNSVAFTAMGQPTSWTEVIGFVTGAWCVWLVARQRIGNWPIGIANNLAFGLLFTTAGLYADAGLQVIYLVLAAWGWYTWSTRGPTDARLPVTRSRAREWAWLIGAMAVGTPVLAWLLTTYSTSTVPLADAATTALSLGATYGQARKRLGSWYLWIAADVIYIPLYLVKHLELTAVLYTVFLILCLIGLRDWRRAVGSVAGGTVGNAVADAPKWGARSTTRRSFLAAPARPATTAHPISSAAPTAQLGSGARTTTTHTEETR